MSSNSKSGRCLQNFGFLGKPLHHHIDVCAVSSEMGTMFPYMEIHKKRWSTVMRISFVACNCYLERFSLIAIALREKDQIGVFSL